jgi:hypothetical protein
MKFMGVTLNAFESAVFLAREAYTDNKRKNKKERIKLPYELKDYNIRYTDEYRIRRWQEENDKIDFILNYLEKHYPNNKDYPKRFMEWQGNEWRELLKFSTEESKKCDCHSRDEFHCKLKRKSGCYTCCYYCFSPGLCEWAECKLLKGDK